MENNEDLYYKKVYLSTGEVPEEDGDYDTDIGLCKYAVSEIHTHNPFKPQYKWTQKGRYGTDEVVIPEYFMKPSYISPKEEAVEVLKWVLKNPDKIQIGEFSTSGNKQFLIDGWPIFPEDIYTKFKEGR